MSKKEEFLTQDFVKARFDYSDGKLYLKEDIYQNLKKGDFTGTYSKDGYYRVTINGVQFFGHRIIFIWHKGYLPKFIDHIDTDPSNCKIENLRECNQTQNNTNKCAAKNSISRYLGVSFKKQTGRWIAAIRKNGKSTHIGYYLNEADAALAYNKLAVMCHGEFARLNIINLD